MGVNLFQYKTLTVCISLRRISKSYAHKSKSYFSNS